MRNRVSLMLMEQLVMVLVFALAAALCLRGFVEADRISQETVLRDRAALMAQNGAEVLKGCSGDLEKTAGMLGGTVSGPELTVQTEELTMKITLVDSGIPGLGQSQIGVYAEEETVFLLRTGWQEVNQ